MKKLIYGLCVLFLTSICNADTTKVFINDLNHNKALSENDLIEMVYENGYYEEEIVSSNIINKFDYTTFDKNKDGLIQTKEYQNYLNYIYPDKHEVALVSSTKKIIKAKIKDVNHNGYIDVDEPYEFNTNCSKEVGKIKASLLESIKSNGFSSDNLITTLELKAYFDSLKQYSWDIELVNNFVSIGPYERYTIITDSNSNSAIDVNEKYLHLEFNSNGSEAFKEKGYISQLHLDTILNNGYDANNDGLVQAKEFEAACLGLLNKKVLVILAPPIINTKKYWDINIGNYWEYENFQDTTKLSKTKIIPGHLPNRDRDAFFSKNHIDTYWGKGADMCYRMGLYWNEEVSDSLDAPNLAASSSRSYTNSYDGNPDAIVYWNEKTTNPRKKYADYWNVKTHSCKGNIPYIVYPKILDVENFTVDSTQGQFHLNYDYNPFKTTKTSEYGHPWKIKYEWYYVKTKIGYEGLALHLMVDEEHAVPSIYEDWYFVEGLGVIRIEQYTTTERTNNLVRIDTNKVFLNW